MTRAPTDAAAGFIPTEIDPREFVYRPIPDHYGYVAASLHGTSRDQWRWWYQAKRQERRKDFKGFVTGEIGHMQGFVFHA